MQIGDICKIWNGKSSISEPNNWLIGIVIKKKKNVNWATVRYQAMWNDDRGIDKTWYEEKFMEDRLEKVCDALNGIGR